MSETITIHPIDIKSKTSIDDVPLISSDANVVVFKDVWLEPKNNPDGENSVILQAINGCFQNNELFGIMGGSGSGKTSLLNVLAGRKASTRGEFLSANQSDRTSTPLSTSWRHNIAYCEQDDALSPFLTCKETLYFSLLVSEVHEQPRQTMKASTSTSHQKRIEALLQVLSLTKVANNAVGSVLQRGLSGGERRRLSIGVELCADSPVLMVDEATSGLDSANAMRVMKTLRRLAHVRGKAVVVSVHQPRATILTMFDKLLILSHGRQVFYGAQTDVLPFFSKRGYPCPLYENPADFLLDILDPPSDEEEEDEKEKAELITQSSLSDTKDDNDNDTMKISSDLLPDSWQSSHEYTQLMKSINPLLKSSVSSNEKDSLALKAGSTGSYSGFAWVGGGKKTWAQSWHMFTILFRKQILIASRNPSVRYVRILSAGGVGLLIGLIFYNLPRNESSQGSRVNVLLFVMCVFSLFCLPAISTSFDERIIFYRDRAAGRITTLIYFWVNLLVEVPLLAIIVLAYSLVSYFLVGLRYSFEHFMIFTLVVYLVVCIGFSIAQATAAASTHINMAIAIYMTVLVYSLLMGGFIVSPDELGTNSWLVLTSYFWFGYEVLVCNEFSGENNAETLFDSMGMNPRNITRNLTSLFIMFVLLRLIALAFLAFKTHQKR